MRWRIAIGCGFLGVATLLWGQGASEKGASEVKPSDIVKETLEIMEKIAGQLAAIKDEETAKSGRDELKKSVAKWLDMRKRAEKLKPPASKEEKDRLEKEFRGKLINADKKLRVEIERVARVPGGRDALKEIVALMKKKPK